MDVAADDPHLFGHAVRALIHVQRLTRTSHNGHHKQNRLSVNWRRRVLGRANTPGGAPACEPRPPPIADGSLSPRPGGSVRNHFSRKFYGATTRLCAVSQIFSACTERSVLRAHHVLPYSTHRPLVGPPSPIRVPLHADIVVMDEPRPAVVRRAHHQMAAQRHGSKRQRTSRNGSAPGTTIPAHTWRTRPRTRSSTASQRIANESPNQETSANSKSPRQRSVWAISSPPLPCYRGCTRARTLDHPLDGRRQSCGNGLGLQCLFGFFPLVVTSDGRRGTAG
jgi:hypothetical protein